MLLEYEFRSCSRACAATGRPLQAGEVYFSVLDLVDNEFRRQDFAAESWQGPPEDCIGWWRSRLPTRDDTQPHLAPTDVMLNLFETLEDRPTESEFRYLLGLLLIRRKTLRSEDRNRDDQGREVLTLHCARRQKEYELVVAEPAPERAKRLQQQMFDLLYGTTPPSPAPVSQQGEL